MLQIISQIWRDKEKGRRWVSLDKPKLEKNWKNKSKDKTKTPEETHLDDLDRRFEEKLKRESWSRRYTHKS